MACFTSGSDCEPEMMVNVPRAFRIGLTPIWVKRLSVGVPELTGCMGVEGSIKVAAESDNGAAVAAAAESIPVDFRRSRRVTRVCVLWFSKVKFLFAEMTMLCW
jgi:hypothetical protein